MQIFVKTINGETLMVETAAATVVEVKQNIEEIEGIPIELQRLVFEGKDLEDGRELANYNVAEKATLHLTISLDGGGPYIDERQLARYYLIFKKICRKCYGRLPPNATRCRKTKCGRTTNLRYKKALWYNKLPQYFDSFKIKGLR